MARTDYFLELDTVITNALIGIYENTGGAIASVGMKKVESYYNAVSKHLESVYDFRVIDVPGKNRMFKLSVMHDEFFDFANIKNEDFLILRPGANMKKIKQTFQEPLPWQVKSSFNSNSAISALLHGEGEFIEVEK